MNGVLLRVESLTPETLLTRLIDMGVSIRRASITGPRTLSVWLYSADERAALAYLDRFSVRYTVVRREFGSGAVRYIRRRFTLAAGIFLCLALLVAVSGRVWRVDAPERFAELLSSRGISVGMHKRDVDTDALSRQLLAEAPEYAYIGVRLDGVLLTVEAVAAREAPDTYRIADGRDLTADADGLIVSVRALAGHAKVRPGDVVRAGDVLIEGYERQSADGALKRVSALGEVVARTWVSGEAVCRTRAIEKVYSGRESARAELCLLSARRVLTSGEPFAVCDADVEVLTVGGLFLPVKIERTVWREFSPRERDVDSSLAEQAAFACALSAARAKIPPDALISDLWVQYDLAGDGFMRAKVIIELKREIAVPKTGG